MIPMTTKQQKEVRLLGKVDEKPEYTEDPGEKPELQSHTFPAADDTIPGKTAYYVEAWYTYKGKTVKSERIKAGFFLGSSADQKEGEARASIQAQFDKDCQEWDKEKEAYNKWTAWKEKRNSWLQEMTEKGYFETRTTSTEFDDYAQFWAGVASIALGKTGSQITIEDYLKYADDMTNLDSLINTLYPQVYDENGEPRSEVRNLLNEKIENIKEDINNLYPDQSPDKPNQGGSGNGSTGNTGGGSTSGGGSGSGNTGGGSTSGGGSGSGNAGEEKPEEPADTVAPTVEKVSLVSPTTGIYTKGQEVKIRVDFDKNVYGTEKRNAITESTAPKLLIKFGDNGESKQTNFDAVSGKTITYCYRIEENDNGKLQLGTADNYLGTVYNKDGYKAELTSTGELETDKEIEADNMAPQVEKIEVISQEGEYKIEDEIQIKVTFNETVYTEKNKIPLINQTAPNLNISFGEGEIRNPAVAEINDTEKYIIYTYKIIAEDRGTLKLDAQKAFDGTKTICDQVGNEVTLIVGKNLEGSTITANRDLTQIFLDKKEITLDLNGTKSTELMADKDKAVDLIWESSNSSVVTIGEEIHKIDLEPLAREVATLTAVGVGESTISIKAPDGTIATCKVTVKDTTNGITKIELNKTKLEFNLKENKTENLIATVTPNELAIEWSSTNTEVVTIDHTGKVTAIATGEAQIMAKAQDGTTAICEVKVTENGVNGIEPTSIAFNVQNSKVVLGKTR